VEITYESITKKLLLLEVYNFNTKDEFLDREQVFGIIEIAGPNGMALRRLSDAKIMTLPGSLDAIEVADPEGYELDATGEIVKPDFISAWKIYVED